MDIETLEARLTAQYKAIFAVMMVLTEQSDRMAEKLIDDLRFLENESRRLNQPDDEIEMLRKFREMVADHRAYCAPLRPQPEEKTPESDGSDKPNIPES